MFGGLLKGLFGAAAKAAGVKSHAGFIIGSASMVIGLRWMRRKGATSLAPALLLVLAVCLMLVGAGELLLVAIPAVANRHDPDGWVGLAVWAGVFGFGAVLLAWRITSEYLHRRRTRIAAEKARAERERKLQAVATATGSGLVLAKTAFVGTVARVPAAPGAIRRLFTRKKSPGQDL
jgi:hypothetical protein